MAALSSNVKQSLEKEIEAERIVRVAFLLIKSGAVKQGTVFQDVVEFCVSKQKADGGWIGVEDSVWSVAFLKEYKECSQEYANGLEWLKKQQLGSGGWGKTSRDLPRIPITGILLFLLPELSNIKSLGWLESEWRGDFASNPKLTYKGAFCLMALKSCNFRFIDVALFDNTLRWLMSQQNEDGGWGPWKGHPVGSTPFCTGVALTGLLQYPKKIDQKVIAIGLEWIEKHQLKNGLWPDHYIEEGSIWSLYALTEGYKFLKGQQ